MRVIIDEICNLDRIFAYYRVEEVDFALARLSIGLMSLKIVSLFFQTEKKEMEIKDGYIKKKK